MAKKLSPKPIPLFKVFMPKEVNKAVLKTLHSGYLSEGERVKEFREKVRKFLGTENVVPVSSCTMALKIAYNLAGVGPGTQVISTPLTSICTNAPILELGANIVWADCEPKTGIIDPSKLEALITRKTKAIVVLHKDGDLAKMDEILAIAKKHNVKVVEDAAHAYGAKYKNKKVGTIGDFTCFSFQAIKQLTTADGGVLVCKDEQDYLLAKKLKWLGLDKENLKPGIGTWENDISVVGYKGNMNDLSATIGTVQMKYAPKILKQYHDNGALYTKLLKNTSSVTLVDRVDDAYPTHWVYTFLTDKREEVILALKKEGIMSAVVHPRNDNYSVFKKFSRKLPGVDYYEKHELSLPCGWWVSKEDIKRIVEIIKKTHEKQ